MKNLFKKAMLFAAAAMAFVSCNNDINDVNGFGGVDVTINATVDETRSHFGDYNADAKRYPTLWSGNEEWAVCANNTKVTTKDIEFATDYTAASAKVTFSADSAPEAYNGTYTLFAVSPSSQYVSVSMESDYIRYRVPGSQTPRTDSCDEKAQVLIAHSEPAEVLSDFNVTFKHAVAYGNFSFVNVAEGGNVTGVTIKSADVALVGRYVYAPSTKTISFKDEGMMEINLTTSSTTNLWFACGPAQVQGKKLTFVINTDKGDLEKEVTMPGNFVAGKVATFKIDMAGIDYPVVEEVIQYKKVASLADITAGEYVIVHEVNSKMFVLPNTTATAKSQVSQILLSSKATINSDILTNVKDEVKWVLTGTTSAMKIKSYANEKDYLYTISDNNGLRISPNDNSSTITWAIEAYKTGYSIKDSKNSRYCGVYTSGSDWRTYTTHHANYGSNGAALTFYKKVAGGSEGGETPEVPETPATPEWGTVTAPAEVAAAGGSTSISYSITDATEGKFASATTTADWITDFTYTANEVTFNVAPNTGVYREAIVTLSYEGITETKDVTVKQAAGESTGDDEPATKVWTLVTDASTLKAGDQIIIAASGYNYAISTSQNSNNRGQAAITKSGNTLSNPGSTVQILTVEAGSTSGTFAFYAKSTVTNSTGYLYCASTSSKNYLRTQASKDAKASWTISVTNTGIATIKSQVSGISRNLLSYNQQSSCFACYSSVQNDVVIYKLQ